MERALKTLKFYRTVAAALGETGMSDQAPAKARAKKDKTAASAPKRKEEPAQDVPPVADEPAVNMGYFLFRSLLPKGRSKKPSAEIYTYANPMHRVALTTLEADVLFCLWKKRGEFLKTGDFPDYNGVALRGERLLGIVVSLWNKIEHVQKLIPPTKIIVCGSNFISGYKLVDQSAEPTPEPVFVTLGATRLPPRDAKL